MLKVVVENERRFSNSFSVMFEFLVDVVVQILIM